MKFSNLILWVQENTLSAKWYKKVGFTIVRSTDELTVVRLDDFEIWLVNMRDEERFADDALVHDKGKGVYVYIAVDNVETTYRRLMKNGVQPHTQPKDWPWGTREFIAKDPDGYKMCFWQKAEEDQ